MGFQWYTRRRYTFLLLAILLLLILHPLVRGFVVARWLYDLLMALVFAAALLAIFQRKAHRLVAVLLGGPTLIANGVGYVLPGLPQLPLVVVLHLLSALFLAFAAATILVTIHEAKAVTTDSLAGAFSGYILAGLFFTHVYCILEALTPGSFHVPTELEAGLHHAGYRREILNYFSLITLTTVGYGDVVPASPTARELACVEAVVGQFYIAVVMAELIGLRVSQPRGD
jgi:hypothetical protein